MMNRKKIAGLAALCLVLLSVLGGCAKSQLVSYDNDTKDMVSITFFGNKYEPENVTVIEEILSAFMTWTG